jgi:hypothetical protein
MHDKHACMCMCCLNYGYIHTECSFLIALLINASLCTLYYVYTVITANAHTLTSRLLSRYVLTRQHVYKQALAL